jgi:hypothetical protein
VSNPLQFMGLQRAKEGLIEAMVPLFAAFGGWYLLHKVLSAPAMSRPLTTLELTVLLGACSALTGWAISRQLYLLRQRRPWVILFVTMLFVAMITMLVSSASSSSFKTWCTETAVGEMVAATGFIDGSTDLDACRVGGVPGNPYLPGVVYRANWPGWPTPLLWAFMLGTGALASLALRDKRLFPSRLGEKLFRRLMLAPAAGSETAAGKPKPKAANVQACANATMWGELCGQIYAAEKEFHRGENCARCYQTYRRAQQELSFRVVTLFSDSIDVLNGLERMDTVSWGRNEPMPPDARISGQERWVELGTLRVPDVITVAQTLALAQESMGTWETDADPRTKEAIRIARGNASRVSGWIWFGPVADRLTYARPTSRSQLAIGPTRLRDIVPQGGEELTLQLDIGLLPLELRVGFRKTFLEEGRSAEAQNSKVDMWIPISPRKLPKDQAGMWVPRVEGAAMRAWLSTERLRPAEERGTSAPLPYVVYRADEAPPDSSKGARPGSLDFVRMPLDRGRSEPTMVRAVGGSIAEWDWLEWEQIELLRQESLVLMESDGGRR